MQNATEIQQKVINLVELYRTKVSKESDIAKKLAAEYNLQYNREIDYAQSLHEHGGIAYVLNTDIPEDKIEYLMANEQLLGHFYKEVAGENVATEILQQFLPEKYDATIYSTEEETFLKSHFSEMVNYIIQTPCNCLDAINRNERKDALLIPKEVLQLINSRAKINAGSEVYNPFAGFAQFASLYPDSHFYCGENYGALDHEVNTKHPSWNYAWTKLAIEVNRLNAETEIIPQKKWDAVISYLHMIPEDGISSCDPVNKDWITEVIYDAFKALKIGGQIVLICPNKLLEKSTEILGIDNLCPSIQAKFRKTLVKECSKLEIIQLPCVMSKSTMRDGFCLIIGTKGKEYLETTMIDARFAFKKSDNKNFKQVLDLEALNTVFQNNGKDKESGLRKAVTMSVSDLMADLLLPQVYVIERPSETEHPVPLSDLCTLESSSIRDVQYDLPEDTPWISINDLSTLYAGDMDMSAIRKADCPNNPTFVEGSEDYTFNKDGKFIDNIWAQINTKKGHHVLEYRQCTFIDGNSDVVLYERSVEDGGRIAVIRSTSKPYAVSKGILAFRPKDGVDANTIAALLRLPIVYRQLIAYEQFGVVHHLDGILVPTDKRVIGDELYRMKREDTVTKELEDNYSVAQKKHKDKLEDYQHAMRKHIREISSSTRRMERFINDMDSSDEAKKFLKDRLAVIKSHRLHLSEDIERLNEENTYGEASPFDIDHCLRSYREYFGADVCPIKYTNEIANDSIRQYRMNHQEELKELDDKSRNKNLEVVLAESSLAYVDIAEYNFGKIVRNILENAKKHGFDDFADDNHEDCVIEIVLNWDRERQMFRIDFRNNGNPLPEGLTKDSYGENRKYAGRTGGTGIGGYEVAENVRHYNGDYAISQDGKWIVVSIYLPKSKTYGERL